MTATDSGEVADFTAREQVTFETDGQMVHGYYVSRWTAHLHRVTSNSPENWHVGPDGTASTATYVRSADEITRGWAEIPPQSGEPRRTWEEIRREWAGLGPTEENWARIRQQDAGAHDACYRKDTGMAQWVAYDSTSCDVLADGSESAIRWYRAKCSGSQDGTVCIAPESEWKRVAAKAAKEMGGNPPRRYPSGIEHLNVTTKTAATDDGRGIMTEGEYQTADGRVLNMDDLTSAEVQEIVDDGNADEETGTVQTLPGHVARVGRYVLVSDSTGTHLHTSRNVTNAARMYGKLSAGYAKPSG